MVRASGSGSGLRASVRTLAPLPFDPGHWTRRIHSRCHAERSHDRSEADRVGKMDLVGTGAIARPASKTSVAVTTAADPFDDFLPAVAAVPYMTVDPRDPHFLERSEEVAVSWRERTRNAAPRMRAPRRPPLPLPTPLMWGQPPPAVPVAKRPCPRAVLRLRTWRSILENESRL